MATGHFVTGLQATLHCQVDFHHLDHTGGQIVALSQFFALFFKRVVELRTFLIQGFTYRFHIGSHGVIRHANVEPFVVVGKFVQILFADFRAFGQLVRAAVGDFADQGFFQTGKRVTRHNTHLIFQIVAIAVQFVVNDRLCARIAGRAFAREHLYIDHGTDHAARHAQ